MTPRAVWAIGAGQLVNWGVLYYAFGVLLVPVGDALGQPRWIVAGAFSFALLISALAAPAMGRLADRGQGPVALQAGGLLAAALLVLWAAVPNIWITYLAWAGLGLCMAAILYEPVFAIVGRSFADADARLRAIASITVMGGLASTAFIPATAIVSQQWGWRGAVLALAAAIAVATIAVTTIAFQDLGWSLDVFRDAVVQQAVAIPASDGAQLRRLSVVFAASSFVNAALSTNLVPALMERRLSATTAATIAGLFGVMQLPGRVLMTHRGFTLTPATLLTGSFAMQIASLVVLAIADSMYSVVAGVLLFACGAGLTTLARPALVLHSYGVARAGQVNGVIARWQQLARAGGPVGAAALATLSGYAVVFGAMAACLSIAALNIFYGDRPAHSKQVVRTP